MHQASQSKAQHLSKARHLSQWSWCPAESLCETVENPLFILLFQTHGLYSFCCYNVIIYSLCYFNLNCNSLCCYNLIVYSVCRYKFILYFLSFYNLIHSSSLLLQPHHIFLILLQPHPLFLMFLQPNPQFLMLLKHPLLQGCWSRSRSEPGFLAGAGAEIFTLIWMISCRQVIVK